MKTPLPLPVLSPHPECQLCSLHSVAKSVGIATHVIPPSRPDLPPILVVGQNPGFNEDTQGIPFIGRSGQLIQDVYFRGIRLQDTHTIYLANTARCFHRDGKGPKNTHYRRCRPYLLDDMRAILTQHPATVELPILFLGGPAASHGFALFHILGMTLNKALSQQGHLVPIPGTKVPARLFCTFHPAYVLRLGKMIYAVQDHLRILRNHLDGRAPSRSLPDFVVPFFPPDPPGR